VFGSAPAGPAVKRTAAHAATRKIADTMSLFIGRLPGLKHNKYRKNEELDEILRH
jgi:hypothetical protein